MVTKVERNIGGFMLFEELEALKSFLLSLTENFAKSKALYEYFLAPNKRYTGFLNIFVTLPISRTIPVTVAL